MYFMVAETTRLFSQPDWCCGNSAEHSAFLKQESPGFRYCMQAVPWNEILIEVRNRFLQYQAFAPLSQPQK
jgi:hypothetical protein